jgi:hypothetical protein
MARSEVVSGRIDVGGLKELNRDLKSLAADKADIIKANVEAAETLIKAAMPLVPMRTGALRSTLKPSKAANYAQANAGSPKRVPYANPIHWGWSIVGPQTKSKLQPGTIRNIAPQPFFSKALGYTKDEIITNYERNMQNLINKYGLGDK